MTDRAPVVDSLTADKTTLVQGDTAVCTVAAHDADARTVTVNVDVTDSAGGAAHGSLTLTITDPLTYVWTCTDTSVQLAPSADGTTCRVTA